jgi:hypothetical protein
MARGSGERGCRAAGGCTGSIGASSRDCGNSGVISALFQVWVQGGACYFLSVAR